MKLRLHLCIALLYLMYAEAKAQLPVLSSYPGASATLFLDFDGHTVKGTSWNWTGEPIVCSGSGLTAEQVMHVFNRVAEDYRPFNINVTTDSVKFLSAPVDRRMRVIITTSSSWYGNTAGGVAFVGTFTSGDDTPCFVFSALFGYNLKKISEAVSHEAGHTFGLYHQAQYDENCNKITDYYAGQGSGEIGWAPIMGVGYSRNFTLWGNGPNSLGCSHYQSDLDIITSPVNGFGYRSDDHDKSFETATQALFANNRFEMEGVVERNDDEDLFRFDMPGKGRFQLNAVPYNVGTGNAGSNLDMQVTLYNTAQEEVGIYNPGTLLNSVADTTLNPGVYYLKVEGKGNQYAPAYASLGSYSLHAMIEPGEPLKVHNIELKGVRNGDLHQLSWSIEADEKIIQQSLEVSTGRDQFTSVFTTGGNDRSFVYRPASDGAMQYRLRVQLDNEEYYYSNTINFHAVEPDSRPRLISNIIQSNNISVSSPGNIDYAIVDMQGRTISRGKLVTGINNITIETMPSGMYIVQFTGQQQQWTSKLLRQ